MKALSDNLYFKNLDNNAGVFHTLIDAAEDEDFKEAVLAYSFLLNCPTGCRSVTIDEQIEHWFKSHYQCELDFEISDALSKLERMQLVEVKNGVYHAVSLEKAKQQLVRGYGQLST